MLAPLVRAWWQPKATWVSRLLQPLSMLYGRMAQRRGRLTQPQRMPVPVVVVGNLVVGGAGKTPTVIALVRALQAAGHRPGVISRGFGRDGLATRAVRSHDLAPEVGDEPLLIARRTGVPVWVARARAEAGRALCAAHPQVDVLVSDDGLQHHALARDAALVVFDDRGAGNGMLLPAGPLREPLPQQLPPRTWLLYTGTRQSTPLPGPVVTRSSPAIWPLAEWWQGAPSGAEAVGDTAADSDAPLASSSSSSSASASAPAPTSTRTPTPTPLSHLRGRRVLAMAGLGDPQKFFATLEQAGVQIDRLALPDHHPYRTLPWPPETTEIITTEKDAIKLDPNRIGPRPQIWVLPLDFCLPAPLFADLHRALFDAPRSQPLQPPRSPPTSP